MQTLLEKIGIINLKYNLIEDESKFNIFSILRNSSDEVHLHSRFIYELLSPNGSHNKGKLFLDSFLTVMGIDNFNTENVSITRERWKIDILIRNSKKQAIIIENKIRAEDQQDQFFRYYEKVKEKGFEDIRMYYLTPFGHESSEKSVGKLSDELKKNALFCKSYQYDITKWLDIAIGLCACYPSLRETLVQYKNLVNNLTGNSMSNNLKEDVVKLLKSGDNIINAQKIAANWVHVNYATEWNFWEDLETKMGETYTVLDASKYTAALMNTVYFQARNKHPWYGVAGEIAKIEDFSLCICFERGEGDLYYGIALVKDGKRANDFKPHYPALSKAVADLSNEDGEWWLGYSHIEPKINFNTFHSEETLRLLNDDYRKKAIEDIWASVESYLEDVKEVMSSFTSLPIIYPEAKPGS